MTARVAAALASRGPRGFMDIAELCHLAELFQISSKTSSHRSGSEVTRVKVHEHRTCFSEATAAGNDRTWFKPTKLPMHEFRITALSHSIQRASSMATRTPR